MFSDTEKRDAMKNNCYQLRKQAARKFTEMVVDKYRQALDHEDLFIVDKLEDVPEQSGLYFFYERQNDNLVYIGRALNIKTRVIYHEREAEKYDIGCWLFPGEELRFMEWALIASLKPANQRKYSINTTFLNTFDISNITGIPYKRNYQ